MGVIGGAGNVIANRGVTLTKDGVKLSAVTPAEQVQKNTATEAENNKGESEEILFKLRNAIPEINMEPVENNSSDMLNNVAGKTMAEKGWNIFRNILGTITRSKFGEIIIDTTSIKDDLGHGIGPAKAATIKAVPAVIKNGKQIDFQPNWKNRGYDTFVFAAPTTLDGKTVYVAAVVKQSKQNNKFYLHEVLDSNGNIIKISTKFAANPTGLAAESGARTANQVLEDTIPQPAEKVKNNSSTEEESLKMSLAEGMGLSTPRTRTQQAAGVES